MRIFICGDSGQPLLLDQAADILGARGHEIVRGPIDTPGRLKIYSEAERIDLIDPCDVAVFTVRHSCSQALMVGAPRLRGVCYPTIGVETLDLLAANELGLLVGHGAVRGNVIGMAESTIMLILMLLYDVRTNVALMEAGQWRRPGHNSHQLEGRTIGLLGFGRIAREIAARLAPFGTHILTYSPRARSDQLPENVQKIALDDLLTRSDVVCVLTGLTPETHHMLNAERLARMRPDAYLVNTGRGAVVDELALIDVLERGIIAGAALDTFEVEPLPADSRLRTLSNVIMTPHCVGHTREGWDELVPTLVGNVENLLRGELPLHCKNPEAEAAWRQRLQRLDPALTADI